jgi:hypothetical protein
VTYALVISTYLALIVAGLGFQGLALAAAQNPAMAESLGASGFEADAFRSMGLSLLAPSILGILLLWRPVRGLLRNGGVSSVSLPVKRA